MSQYEEELNLICLEVSTDWKTTNKDVEDNMRDDINNKVKEKNWLKKTVPLSNAINEKTTEYLSVISNEKYEFLIEIKNNNKTAKVIWKDTKLSPSVTLTYNPNGGDGEEKTQSIRQGFSVSLQECEYTKANYKFVGWCEDANGDEERCLKDNIYGPLNENKTLYAIWAENTATITFNSNGGTGTMETRTVEKGKNHKLPNNSITRTGYNFLGWTDRAGSTEVKYENCATINIMENVTLYAVWEKLMTVSYNGNGATSGSMSVDYVESGKSVTLTTNTYIKTGYYLSGWNTKADGTGTSYSNGTTISNVTENITLYAQWKIDKPEVIGSSSTTHKAVSLDSKYPGITWETIVKIAKGISDLSSISSTTTQEVTVNVRGKNYTVGIGDTKDIITINGSRNSTRILGFNHDTLAKSGESKTGKAGISFQFVGTINTSNMNYSGTNEGGWTSSTVYSKLGAGGSGWIYNDLLSRNSGLAIKQVVKKYIPTYNVASTSNSNDYIWLLACSEIWNNGYKSGCYGYAITSEGSQYRYFANLNPDYLNSSEPLSYRNRWLRSPCAFAGDSFCIISSNGARWNHQVL